MSLDAIFKAYDIRGIYPDEIDDDLARRVGNAFARFTGAETVVVGHDMRPSSPGLAESFTEGATLAGADVVQIGLCSTDVVYFASGRLDVPGAMFTASHNPAQYNGIKLCRAGAAPVGEDTGLAQIKATVAAGVLEKAAVAGSVTSADMLIDFGAHVRGFIDPAQLRPLRVVADTANGMGGLVVPIVFDTLPFDLTVLYGELDGTFPNHPADPIQVENLADLRKAVVDNHADIGLAFDGDADRVFLVDDLGAPVSGSTTTSIVAKSILEKHPGESIVHNLICSRAVPEIVRENGGTPVRSRVGHSFIKQVMADTGAIFGGEHSAHYYFRDFFRADSGMLAALHVLAALGEQDEPLSELMAQYTRYAASGEVNSTVDDPRAKMAEVEELYGDREDVTTDTLDGLTVSFANGDWFNLRPSNTEPLLRLNVEASDAGAVAALRDDVLAVVRR
ncbi:MAG TPA: phosphomannomutase/phosphoglucomutase [Acidimicrobiia bacterium]